MYARLVLVSVLAFALLLAARFEGRTAQQSPALGVVDIGLPAGASNPRPVDLTNNATILLNVTEGGISAVYLHRDGSFTRIGDNSVSVHGSAINDNGLVAGWSGDDEASARAVLIESEHLVELPGDLTASRALGLNSEGSVVGSGITTSGGTMPAAVYWTDVSSTLLPAVSQGEFGAAYAINTIGQIAGWSAADPEATGRHATVWVDGIAQDLGTLGGMLSEARAINNVGTVAGVSTTAESQTGFDQPGATAFRWRDGTLTALPLGDGMTWAIANDINDNGVIVGTVGGSGTETAAVIWTESAVLDLNHISMGPDGLRLVEGLAINDLGQIVCLAVDQEGNSRVALLSILGN